MPAYKANAIVLRRIPLGETDKIVTLFTREYGKFNAVAKGARRTTSRLAGATEPLMLLRALLAEGMNLDVLTQCEIRESFPLLRGDFGLILRATYLAELLDRFTVERAAEPEAFDLLISALFILQRAVDPDVPVHAFELQLMALSGYEPRLDACARCGRELSPSVTAYSPSRGGLLCPDCADDVDDALPILPETAAAMEKLLREDDAHALARMTLEPPVRAELIRVLRAHLRYRLEREVRSTEFLDAFRLGAMDIADTGSGAPGPSAP